MSMTSSEVATGAVLLAHRPVLLAHLLRVTDGDETAALAILGKTLCRAAISFRDEQPPPRIRPWLIGLARAVAREPEAYAWVTRSVYRLAEPHRRIVVDLCYRDMAVDAFAARHDLDPAAVPARLDEALNALA
jgi:DNA-directed RNA polymerase specialized sigma24 family protein